MFIYTSFRIAMKLYNLDTLLESYIVPSLWNSYSLRFGIYTFWGFGIHTPTSFHTYTLWHFKFKFETMDLIHLEDYDSYALRLWIHMSWGFTIGTSWGFEFIHLEVWNWSTSVMLSNHTPSVFRIGAPWGFKFILIQTNGPTWGVGVDRDVGASFFLGDLKVWGSFVSGMKRGGRGKHCKWTDKRGYNL